MARLFGGDAAERRLAAVTTPSDATAANLMLPPPDVPSEPRLSPLNQIAMHLHLPPPRLPPWRIAGPLLALLLSAGGLLFGLHSQRANRALSATVPAATAALPLTPPALKLVPRTLHLGQDPAGLKLPPPGAAEPAQKRPTRARHHDRQRRKLSSGV
jgi:hypothetical protein